MPDSKQCLDARALLDEIRLLRSEFELAYARAATYGNPGDVYRADDLRAGIVGTVDALREKIFLVEAERTFDLRRQYDAQTSLLRRAGLVEVGKAIDPFGVEQEILFMRGIDGKRYPLPAYETVFQRMLERRELLGIKADQGFTKLLLVPFGMSLDHLLDRFVEHLERYKMAYDEAHKNDVPRGHFILDRSPLSGDSIYRRSDTSDALVYDPVSFNADHHGGMAKIDILRRQRADRDTAAGWRILFLQEGEDGVGFRDVRKRGTDAAVGTAHPRADLEPGRTAIEYLELNMATSRNADSPYFGESGMCLEEWLVLLLAHLEETERPLDIRHDNWHSFVLLTGMYAVDADHVVVVNWDNDFAQTVIASGQPGSPEEYGSPRFAVRV